MHGDQTDGNRDQSQTSQKKWLGVFWNALLGTTNNSVSNPSDVSNSRAGANSSAGGAKENNLNSPNHSDCVYGRPDTYFATDWKEQNELALPKNVHGNKEELKKLLEETLNNNSIENQVISTHPAIINKVATKLSAKDKEYRHTRMMHQLLRSKYPDAPSGFIPTTTWSSLLRRRFDETKVSVTNADFEALVRLHSHHLSIDSTYFLENDKEINELKKVEYDFYLKLPRSVIHDSINPSQTTQPNF
ncbi:hypothetical protein RFI_12849 [Reticulomyxa filosa]|uniref:Uncharacterized protein n=1 Tax=Reticulomyxa filosa TaxID=46433 RepID=X6NEI8_RETFI|nr:hypothetical protein RFI_12849 [Reticulomyxa filosa]|eukprot:ETO24308.1 hypothetical protein RFI_12849 [Reticulomyxa filosa]